MGRTCRGVALALIALSSAGALRLPSPRRRPPSAEPSARARAGRARVRPAGEPVPSPLAALARTPVGERAAATVAWLRAPVPVPTWLAASTGVLGAAVLGVVALVSVHVGSPTEIEKQALLFGDVLQQVEAGYVQPVDTTALFERGTNGMLHSLDPFTEFENKAARADLDLFTSGAYGGVGLGIAPDPYVPGRILVRDAREGHAYDAGLRVGDHLISIGGEPVLGRTLDDAMALLRGEPGTQVDVEFSRDGDAPGAAARRTTLHRERILVPAVSLAALAPLDEKSACGFAKLGAFSATAASEFKLAVVQLMAQAAREGKALDGLVLDLRGNSGGLLNAALEVCESLLPHGSPLVTTQGREPSSRVTFVSGGAPTLPLNVRLAVLVDGRTASASEIVAGALQDLDRALIVGGRSYGKGLVQSVMPLPYGNELKVTVAKYYTPSGRCIQRLAYAGTDGALAPAAASGVAAPTAAAGTQTPPAPLTRPRGAPATPGARATPAPPSAAADPPAASGAAGPEQPQLASGSLGGGGGAAAAPPGAEQPTVWLSNGGHLIREQDRQSFATLRGRTVRDGGGIEADVPLVSQRAGPVERQLSEADVFFAFARELALQGRLPTPAPDGASPPPFAVDRSLLGEFEQFAAARLQVLGATLRSPVEARLDELAAALQEEEALSADEVQRQLPALAELRSQARAQLDGALRGSERAAIERRIARAVDARSVPDGKLLSRALRSDPQLEAAVAAVKSADAYERAFHFAQSDESRDVGSGRAPADSISRAQPAGATISVAPEWKEGSADGLLAYAPEARRADGGAPSTRRC